MAESNKTSVGVQIVEAFRAEKVEYVFGLTGSHVLSVFDALIDAPEIHHVVSKHESNAGFMASMYGQLTGRPGVALTTAGPGATNAVSGIAQAYNQSSPVVHISGTVPLNAGNEAFHGVDRADFLHKVFADITKWSVRVEKIEDLPDILSRAFSLAVSGRPGPVHIDIPVDLIHAAEISIPAYRSTAVERRRPSDTLLDQVHKALAEAKHPMICAGRGIKVHRAEKELTALAETASAPVLCSSFARGVMSDNHPLYVGTFNIWQDNAFAWELLSECDFLLVLGMRSGTHMVDILAKHIPENPIFIALDEPHTLLPVKGVTSVEICDSRLFLSALLSHADDFKRPANPTLTERIATQKSAFKNGLARYLEPFINDQPLHFGCVMQEVVTQLDTDAIVVSGVGNHNSWSRVTVPVLNRESILEEGSWGMMGSELGSGIAAKLVYPQRQVVVVTGDGSLMMTGADFITAVEEKAPILVVVLNDSRYGMITDMQKSRFGRSFGDEIGSVDFTRFAESFGAAGIRVESPKELKAAVREAIALSKTKPVILDAVCNYDHERPKQDHFIAMGMEEGAQEK